jgi:RNA polymerase sigma factor (sigma-70 family)
VGLGGWQCAPVVAYMSPGISTRLLATQSDERLLALVRQGHERAFEALVHRYRRPLLNYCRRFALPEARAEDVLQQALLKTWIALRGGAEVRDLKAWLYRVVHNTAVNAVRDAAHDGERLADPALRAGAEQADVERGLVLREALAEVAALPRLQREVIVRTAVGGYSHEQVASDLGISDGAVRGLLYRARATLRTAVTALTPPPLLAWLGGRVEQGGPAPERLGELAAGGGAAAGFGGLLAKSGVAILAVGTLVTGAAAVHISGVARHRAPVKVAAVSGASSANGAQTSSDGARAVVSPTVSSRTPAIDRRRQRQRIGGQLRAGSSGTGSALTTTSAGGGSNHSTSMSGTGRVVAPVSAPTSSGTTSTGDSAPSTGTAQGTGSAGGSAGQAEGTGQSGGSGAQSPGGAAASSGSGSESSPAPSAGSASGTSAGGESSGGSSPSGSSSGGASETESSGDQGASGGPGSSGGEQSGGVVGTVVHEVGNLLEHLLH